MRWRRTRGAKRVELKVKGGANCANGSVAEGCAQSSETSFYLLPSLYFTLDLMYRCSFNATFASSKPPNLLLLCTFS